MVEDEVATVGAPDEPGVELGDGEAVDEQSVVEDAAVLVPLLELLFSALLVVVELFSVMFGIRGRQNWLRQRKFQVESRLST